MRPNLTTDCSMTEVICFSSRKSSETASKRFPASGKADVTVFGLREVATTESPRCSAARTSSRPKPCDVPVMNQTSGLEVDKLIIILRYSFVLNQRSHHKPGILFFNHPAEMITPGSHQGLQFKKL